AANPPSSSGRGAGDEGAVATDLFRPITEGPGTVIGPYKLLQQIGEGGFGVVYMAEQQRPVRRKVALKIIKPGMDTREVIARFESERQALALMDHPNIARVFDAGATESGRPYFVMELVKGVPITEYCDKNALPTDKRLALFITVCHAIQHAHQKGVIHRDLKPSNVMVTLHDGLPVPKVIDFGVSKATSQQLTEKTLFTAYGQMIGTPAYMSPEQAEMSGLDIDTRSDTYSLGVLLYELLTGTTPLDGKRLREAGFVEMQRIIREEAPPRPSTRVSTMGDALTVVSSHRSTDPKKLGQQMRGDLDVIVMKAMEKERSRRYDTPNAFADDIQRFLDHEAIVARPASAAYRLKKFAQRNWAATLATLLVALSLLLGTAISTWQAVRATAAERHAQQNLAKALEGMQQMLDRLPDSRLESTPEATASRLAILEDALIIYEALAREPDGRLSKSLAVYRRDLATARYVVAWRLIRQGDCVAAGALFQQEVTASEKALADFPEVPENRNRAAAALSQWAANLAREGDYVKAEQAWRRAILLSPIGLSHEIRQLHLAKLLQTRNRQQEAQTICESVLKLALDGSLRNSSPPFGDPTSLVAGIAHYVLNDWDSAIDAFQSSMKLRKRAGGDSHEYFYLAMTYWQKGQMDDSRRWYDK
ncbi:MAG TPA: serine/threonine-protein kinase, partial [Pirellulaceae bacterium]|nr:serine/threonine-protein kinase [Pirellulaceae bacterium]